MIKYVREERVPKVMTIFQSLYKGRGLCTYVLKEIKKKTSRRQSMVHNAGTKLKLYLP